MRKVFLLAIQLGFLGMNLMSQDIIILKNTHDTIHCKIKEVITDKIYYYLPDSGSIIHGDSELSSQKLVNVLDFKHDFYLISDTLNDMVAQPKDTIPQSKNTFRLPDSHFNLGAGIGFNYGIIGIKGVLGWKNSGILFSGGMFKQKPTGSVGLQVSLGFIYLNAAYGPYGATMYENEDEADINYGLGLTGGGMISLTRNKRLFLELGVGYIWGDKKEIKLGYVTIEEKPKAVTFNVGMNYRF